MRLKPAVLLGLLAYLKRYFVQKENTKITQLRWVKIKRGE